MGSSRAVLIPRVKPRLPRVDENHDPTACVTPHPSGKTRRGHPRARAPAPLRERRDARDDPGRAASVDAKKARLERLRAESRAQGTKAVRAAVADDHAGRVDAAAAGYAASLRHFDVYLKLERDPAALHAVVPKVEQYRARLKRLREATTERRRDDGQKARRRANAEAEADADADPSADPSDTSGGPPRRKRREIRPNPEAPGRFLLADVGGPRPESGGEVRRTRGAAGGSERAGREEEGPRRGDENERATDEEGPRRGDENERATDSKPPPPATFSSRAASASRVTDEEADAWVEEGDATEALDSTAEEAERSTADDEEAKARAFESGFASSRPRSDPPASFGPSSSAAAEAAEALAAARSSLARAEATVAEAANGSRRSARDEANEANETRDAAARPAAGRWRTFRDERVVATALVALEKPEASRSVPKRSAEGPAADPDRTGAPADVGAASSPGGGGGSVPSASSDGRSFDDERARQSTMLWDGAEFGGLMWGGHPYAEEDASGASEASGSLDGAVAYVNEWLLGSLKKLDDVAEKAWLPAVDRFARRAKEAVEKEWAAQFPSDDALKAELGRESYPSEARQGATFAREGGDAARNKSE